VYQQKLDSSVGVVIYDEYGRVLLQKRDQKPTIYFPGLWGLFGGACNKNESPLDAAVRELNEELCVNTGKNIKYLFNLEIDSCNLGPPRKRYFYYVKFSKSNLQNIVLKEGEDFKFFHADSLPIPTDLVPFDFAAVLMFYYTKLYPRQIRPNT
jgi:8-oxo-dGTP diphosphatase